jgi:hypothetical protein
MWIKQKGLIVIRIRINAFKLWLPISSYVLLDLIYGFYELFSFFVMLSGQSNRVISAGKGGKYSTTLKDMDGMIDSVIYFLDKAHKYDKFDLVEIDAGDDSMHHVQVKISFV